MLYYDNTFLPRLSVRMEMMMCSAVFHVAAKVKGIFEFTKENFKIKQKAFDFVLLGTI